MKSKKVISALLIITILMILFNKVFAAGSFSANLTPSSSRVSKGSEVTVTLKVSGISIEDGISGIQGTIKYDTDVLSIEKDSDVKGINDWTATADTSNQGAVKVAFDRAEAVKSDSEVATIKFLVKESTSSSAATVQLASIKGGNASETATISDITTNISIGTATITTSPSASPSVSPSTSPSTSPSASPTVSSTVKPSATTNTLSTPSNENKSTNGTTTVKNEDMPNTGAENYIIPLIVVIAILGIVSFVGYKKIEDK